MSAYTFHQFVRVEKGPVNSVILDFLKGTIVHVSNEDIDKFQQGNYDEIPDFMETVKAGQMLMEAEENSWLPGLNLEMTEDPDKPLEISTLEIEEGADPDAVKQWLSTSGFKILQIVYYGREELAAIVPGVPIFRKEKDFDLCREVAGESQDFYQADLKVYRLNMNYNRCWGKRIAVTADGNFRPCIYSSIVLGHLQDPNREKILAEFPKYWKLTNNQVSTCKECEFKYLCIDCREMVFRESGDLYGMNPYCRYDPYKGEWRS